LTTLPSIQEDLGFSDTSLAWVVNAYLLTFIGFLLLSGRLGDLFGGAVLGAPASVGQAGADARRGRAGTLLGGFGVMPLVAGVRCSFRGKDAGSAHSRRYGRD
jgi:MFS family permease